MFDTLKSVLCDQCDIVLVALVVYPVCVYCVIVFEGENGVDFQERGSFNLPAPVVCIDRIISSAAVDAATKSTLLSRIRGNSSPVVMVCSCKSA